MAFVSLRKANAIQKFGHTCLGGLHIHNLVELSWAIVPLWAPLDAWSHSLALSSPSSKPFECTSSWHNFPLVDWTQRMTFKAEVDSFKVSAKISLYGFLFYCFLLVHHLKAYAIKLITLVSQNILPSRHKWTSGWLIGQWWLYLWIKVIYFEPRFIWWLMLDFKT